MTDVDRLASRLGPYRIKGKEWAFRDCPRCKNEGYNFEVAPSKRLFHCWVCGYGGVIARLFHMLGMVGEELGEVEADTEEEEKETLNLKEWYPVGLVDITKKKWFRYFKDKDLTRADLQKWGVRVQEDTVLFPVIEAGEVLYWTQRDMIKNRWYSPKGWPKSAVVVRKMEYPLDRRVVLVEGMVDAVKVDKAGFNTIALLGTQVSRLVVEFIRRGKHVPIICLDADVTEIKYESIARKLGSFQVAEISGDDPSDLELADLKNRIETARPYGINFRLRKRWQRA